MPFDTELTSRLGIKIPVVQGGMQHVGIAELASAVSNAGGLGILTALTQSADADPGSGDDPGKVLRAALRDAKQVFETGEVLRGTPRPHGERPRTLLGGAVDAAEDDAKGEGVL